MRACKPSTLLIESDVKNFPHPLLVLLLIATLAGCGVPGPKDFGGRWRPVNRFDDKVVEMPLEAPYTYYVAPMDGTLKALVTRWTSDTGMKLDYRLRSDFSLTHPAAKVRTTELRDAAAQLTAIYAAQGIVVRIEGPSLLVEAGAADAAAGAP